MNTAVFAQIRRVAPNRTGSMAWSVPRESYTASVVRSVCSCSSLNSSLAANHSLKNPCRMLPQIVCRLKDLKPESFPCNPGCSTRILAAAFYAGFGDDVEDGQVACFTTSDFQRFSEAVHRYSGSYRFVNFGVKHHGVGGCAAACEEV